VFLTVSAILLLVVLWLAGTAVLPFVLAAIIAYVLTPLVALCERIRIPRALSILIVYSVTFALIYVSIAMIAPRIYVETMKLARDAPALTREVSRKWGPRIDAWLQGIRGRTEPPKPEAPPPPAFEVIKRADDGGYNVELRGGVDVIRESETHWRIVPLNPVSPDKLSVTKLLGEGVDRFIGYVQRNAVELIKFGRTVISTVARGIFLLFMTLMLAGYMMHTRESILNFFRSLPPPRSRIGFDRLLWRIDRGLSGVVRGQLLICLVNGVLSAIGFAMFGLKYWPILAVVAGVMSIIPIFGSILSSVPVVLIGLTQSFPTALWVLLWIILIHQVEANFLNPNIIGVAARIHPVLVVFALVFGEHLYGLWGALLAVPAVSMVQSVFNHFRYESLPEAGPDSIIPGTLPPVATPRPR
jgi:predicted PurR-regulated permease PerM